jgi:hypothetical protein
MMPCVAQFMEGCMNFFSIALLGVITLTVFFAGSVHSHDIDPFSCKNWSVDLRELSTRGSSSIINTPHDFLVFKVDLQRGIFWVHSKQSGRANDKWDRVIGFDGLEYEMQVKGKNITLRLSCIFSGTSSKYQDLVDFEGRVVQFLLTAVELNENWTLRINRGSDTFSWIRID